MRYYSKAALAALLVILGFLVKVSGASSSYFNCYVPGLNANANSNGNVNADDNAGSYCRVFGDGNSNCEVNVDGGEK